MNVCQAIKCPYFNSASEGYGCQRYQVSNHCHLLQTFSGLEANQYALYADLGVVDTLNLKFANNEFFSIDEKYKDDLTFQESHADWFAEGQFKVGLIEYNSNISL